MPQPDGIRSVEQRPQHQYPALRRAVDQEQRHQRHGAEGTGGSQGIPGAAGLGGHHRKRGAHRQKGERHPERAVPWIVVLPVDHHHAHHQQPKRPRQHFAEQLQPTAALGQRPAERERDRNSRHEQEAGKHDVRERHRVGLGAGVLQPGRGVRGAGEVVDEDHQRDHQAAQRID